MCIFQNFRPLRKFKNDNALIFYNLMFHEQIYFWVGGGHTAYEVLVARTAPPAVEAQF